MDHAAVQKWLDNYVQAWLTYDRQLISDLFSEDATYCISPYSQPIKGRDTIVADWLKNPDPSGTYQGAYHPIVVEGSTAIANGRSTYFESDGKTVSREFDNIFLLRFDAAGRCTEYAEWYMEKPR